MFIPRREIERDRKIEREIETGFCCNCPQIIFTQYIMLTGGRDSERRNHL